MSESSDRSAFLDAAFSEGVTEGILDIGNRCRSDCPGKLIVFARSSGSWENPMRVAVGFVPATQFDEGTSWQWHITVLATFALLDMNDHTLAVDIGDLEGSAFGKPESTGIDGQQADTVDWETNAIENTPDFFTSEDDGKASLTLGTHQVECAPFLFEGLSKKELNATESNGYRRALPLLDIADVEKILA